jgi:D-3-phosphoglycerate dehydrogenase
MNVGRETQGGEAIGVVNLDSVPTPEALEQVTQHPDIISATLIKLPPLGAEAPWLAS